LPPCCKRREQNALQDGASQSRAPSFGVFHRAQKESALALIAEQSIWLSTSREALNTYLQRVRGTLGGYSVRALIDHSRFLEGQGPVEGVQRMPREVGMTAWPISRSGSIGEWGAKYLVILTEGGMLPAEQRMPHTNVTG
jgi:hypothetical protein